MTNRSLFILIGLLNFFIAVSQTDTITYAECEIDTTPNQYDKLLKYFIVDKEEVRHLWKFNAVDWGTFKPSIAFEQRIMKRSSFEYEAKFTPVINFGLFENTISNSLDYSYRYSSSILPSWKFELATDYRFYYNLKRRIQKGKQTNGFSGNYLFLGGRVGIDQGKYFLPKVNNVDPDLPDYSSYVLEKLWKYNYGLKAGYGIQRRIGNIAYADFKFGIMYDLYFVPDYNRGIKYNEFLLFADVNLGFGLRSLKRPLFK